MILLVAAFGCGKTETKTEIKSDIEKFEAENKRLEAELKEEKRKLEAEQQQLLKSLRFHLQGGMPRVMEQNKEPIIDFELLEATKK